MTAVVLCNEMKKQLRDDAASMADGEASRMLMQWDIDICKKLSNKIRVGNCGILDLNNIN